MQEKSTDELDAQLRNTTPDCMDKYYKENRYYIAETSKAFTYYMKDVIDKKNLAFCHSKLYYKDIYSFAGVSESYGEKILNMEKHTKNRDLIIRFCVAGRFQLNEINTALKLYGMKPLYAKDKRDACIIVAINNRKYDLAAADPLVVGSTIEMLRSAAIAVVFQLFFLIIIYIPFFFFQLSAQQADKSVRCRA